MWLCSARQSEQTWQCPHDIFGCRELKVAMRALGFEVRKREVYALLPSRQMLHILQESVICSFLSSSSHQCFAVRKRQLCVLVYFLFPSLPLPVFISAPRSCPISFACPATSVSATRFLLMPYFGIPMLRAAILSDLPDSFSECGDTSLTFSTSFVRLKMLTGAFCCASVLCTDHRRVGE